MKKHLLVALSVLCLCSCFEEKKVVEKPKENIVAKQETKPKKEYKKEPRDYRDGYSSLEGFKFGTSYEEAKRIVEKEVGEIWHEKEERFYRDKNFNVFFLNTIDSIDIGRIEFYFKNNKLYGIKADVYYVRSAQSYLTEELGKPYNLHGKRIWIISKGNETYYLSLYNEIINAEINDDELDICEQDVIEFIKIK